MERRAEEEGTTVEVGEGGETEKRKLRSEDCEAEVSGREEKKGGSGTGRTNSALRVALSDRSVLSVQSGTEEIEFVALLERVELAGREAVFVQRDELIRGDVETVLADVGVFVVVETEAPVRKKKRGKVSEREREMGKDEGKRTSAS